MHNEQNKCKLNQKTLFGHPIPAELDLALGYMFVLDGPMMNVPLQLGILNSIQSNTFFSLV
jgi:hypothetical protein